MSLPSARFSLVCALLVGALACSREPEKTAEPTPAAPTPEASPPAPEPAAAEGRAEGARDAQASAPASAARGAELYGRMCAVCHGRDGEGYVADEATALAHPDLLATVSDDYLSFAIRVGREGTKMSAWHADQGGPLTDADIASLVAHLRTWQKKPPLALDESAAHGDALKGKALFDKHCVQCHGAEGPHVRILNRQLLTYASTGFLRHAITHGRAGTKMPGYGETLGARGIEDVVTHLRTLPAWIVPSEQHGTAEPPPIPLGPVPLNPRGREPKGFSAHPARTSVSVVGPALARRARMALLDARPPSDYAREHIAGAVSVPFYDPSPYLASLPKDAWLVCYCGCPHAESGELANQLTRAGFTKVTVLDEGLDAWRAKGYPMRKGVEP